MASPAAAAWRAIASASWGECVRRSTYPISWRRRARCSSTSIAMQTPSFIVTDSGWAPPIPPRPAVSTTRPRSEPPKCWRASSANVSYVPWRMPCVPM